MLLLLLLLWLLISSLIATLLRLLFLSYNGLLVVCLWYIDCCVDLRILVVSVLLDITTIIVFSLLIVSLFVPSLLFPIDFCIIIIIFLIAMVIRFISNSHIIAITILLSDRIIATGTSSILLIFLCSLLVHFVPR